MRRSKRSTRGHQARRLPDVVCKAALYLIVHAVLLRQRVLLNESSGVG